MNSRDEYLNSKSEIAKTKFKRMDGFSELVRLCSRIPSIEKLKTYVLGKLYGFMLRYQSGATDHFRQKYIKKAETLLWERHLPQDQRLKDQYDCLYHRCADDVLASTYLWPLFMKVTERIETYGR